MSEICSINRERKRTVYVPAKTRRKKYLQLALFLLIAAVIGIAYSVISSGILYENNPQIKETFFTRINLERQANNIPPVQWSDSLAVSALAKSREVKISRGESAGLPGTKTVYRENIFIIPKLSWVLSNYNSRQQIFDDLENGENTFRANLLNTDTHSVGIGISGDWDNYYIVTRWQ